MYLQELGIAHRNQVCEPRDTCWFSRLLDSTGVCTCARAAKLASADHARAMLQQACARPHEGDTPMPRPLLRINVSTAHLGSTLDNQAAAASLESLWQLTSQCSCALRSSSVHVAVDPWKLLEGVYDTEPAAHLLTFGFTPAR